MDGSDNSDGTEGSETGWIMMDRGSDHHVNTNRNGLLVFAENVGVIPDMTGKETVDYYWLFITDSLLQNVLEVSSMFSHQDYLTVHPGARSHDFVKRWFAMSELLWLIVLMKWV